MMVKVGMFEAKTHLPEMVRRVEAGEEICLTKHNQPVAFLVSASAYRKNKNREALEQLVMLGKKIKLGITIDDIIAMRDEGRK